MAVLASSIMDRAQRIILDETNVRWPLPELCMWINDAQREVVIQKPSALSMNAAMALEEGTFQKVPGQYLGLLRVVRNLRSAAADPVRIGGRAVRIVSREVLDTQTPDWHDPDAVAYRPEVKHYIYDEQDPLSFYVYPGNDGTGVIEAVFAGNPADIVVDTGADPAALESYEKPISLPDIYANAMLDFVLYRAYSKDAQFAGNAQRAALHYQQFANSLGIKVQIDAALSPNVPAQTKAS